MPRVWNKRDPNTPKDAVYVGRPTVWGNPFTHHKVARTVAHTQVATREDAIQRYRDEVVPQLTEARIKAALRGKDLVCWCHPAKCHADVLLEIANKEPSNAD
jgi:hypothetical protein